MAAQKTINIKGVDCDYHIISELVSNKRENTTTISLLSYVNQAARSEAIDNHLRSMTIIIDGINSNASLCDRDWAYNELSQAGTILENSTKI